MLSLLLLSLSLSIDIICYYISSFCCPDGLNTSLGEGDSGHPAERLRNGHELAPGAALFATENGGLNQQPIGISWGYLPSCKLA